MILGLVFFQGTMRLFCIQIDKESKCRKISEKKS